MFVHLWPHSGKIQKVGTNCISCLGVKKLQWAPNEVRLFSATKAWLLSVCHVEAYQFSRKVKFMQCVCRVLSYSTNT